MKTRKETVDIELHCDMKDCDEFSRYTDDDAPYKNGWRCIVIHVYDSYNERTEQEISMHVCEACMLQFQDEPENSVE